VDSRPHTIGTVHQEGDGAVVDCRPTSLGLPGHNPAQCREPDHPITTVQLHPDRDPVDQYQILTLKVTSLKKALGEVQLQSD